MSDDKYQQPNRAVCKWCKDLLTFIFKYYNDSLHLRPRYAGVRYFGIERPPYHVHAFSIQQVRTFLFGNVCAPF